MLARARWALGLVLAAGAGCAPRHAEPAAVPVVSSSAPSPPAVAHRGSEMSAAAALDILRYETELHLDWEAHTASGTTTIVYAAGAASTLSLPRNGLTIESVMSGGRPLPHELGPSELVVSLPAAPAGDGRITIAHRSAPSAGLTFGDRFVYTAYFTCRWMPCSEEPGDRATFRLSLVVPEGYQVVASGIELERSPAGPGQVRVVWAEDRPLSTYLFGFAAGVFSEVTEQAGAAVLRYLGAGLTPAALKQRFEPTRGMLQFLEQRAGVALPVSTYTQVLVPGSVAQEASSFSILGREELDPMLTDPTEDWAIVHELSHQWWGNAITCKDWSHFWLNEGVTTFMVAAYKEQRWGAAAYERELSLLRQRHQLAIDAGQDRKLAYAGEYPSLQLRRAIVYSKAALFLHLLRRELGEDAFWRGLRRYTREQLGSSVESRDLQRALETETGKDLSEQFQSWVYD